MPLLHLSLNASDVIDNQWSVNISHTIASQPIVLKEVMIHTVVGDASAIIPINGITTTGKNCLLMHMEQGDGNCLEERQIVSNVLGGSWFPLPCNYEASRSNNQIYTSLDQTVISSSFEHNIIVTLYSDAKNAGGSPVYPVFGTADNNIDKIDVVFQYDDFERSRDA